MIRKTGAFLMVVGLITALSALRFKGPVGLKDLQLHELQLLGLYRHQPTLVIGLFMAGQIVAVTVALPGAVLTTALLAGALFGQALGLLVFLISLIIGDTLAFLVARYVARDWVLRRFGSRLAPIRQAADRDGSYYLLGARLMAVVPYFVVNWGMALTSMPLRVFAPVSFLGLMPAAFIYVNAGTHLAEIRSPSDVLSARLWMSLTLLGFLSIAGRLIPRIWAARRAPGNE